MPMRPIIIVLAVLILGQPVLAQDISFDESLSLSCYYESGEPGHASQDDCVGVSANACMETPGGASTVGMGFCLQAEHQMWDALLNEAYTNLRTRLAENDANTDEGAPNQVDALRDMQRAWITYRDANCAFERSLWGNGSGAGMAQLACLMNETAQQYFVLASEIEMAGL
ncbi:lysozyme inhibitor LprI family protein [Halocynthiibacter sp.]|uniref:lysozyme inhibitor LprI family protein n=1 Tax=Halocynthiibacter sp. TaxID=1979210 RepID=UPI003C4FDCA0